MSANPEEKVACRSPSRLKGGLSFILPLAVSLLMVCLSVHFQRGGALFPEVEGRLPFYLSNGSLPGKIYDSDYRDWGLYQARELGDFVDFVDCKFIAWSVALGHPHFLSLTHYAFLVLISLIGWRFGVEDLKLGWLPTLLVILLLWTTPEAFWGGAFFRTSKIGVALAMVFLFRYVFRVLEKIRSDPSYIISKKVWFTCFGVAWAATLFDRQGVYLVGEIVVFIGFWYFAFRRGSARKLMTPFIAALMLSGLYNHIIAPLLTLSLNDYWPDFRYQQLPWKEFFERPVFFMSAGCALYVDTVRFFLGNVPSWCAVGILAALSFMVFRVRKVDKAEFRAGLGLLSTNTLFVWFMIVLMFLRHGALVWPEIRRVYYFLPLVAIFGMTTLLTLAWLKSRYHVSEVVLTILLALALAGNVYALPGHDFIIRNGSGRECYESTPALIQALRQLKNPGYKAPPEIAQNRVYRFFHDGYFSRSVPILPHEKVPPAKKKNPQD